MSHPRHRPALLLSTTTLLLLFSGGGASAAEDTAPPAPVTADDEAPGEPGAAERLRFSDGATVGQAAVQEMTMVVGIDGDAGEFELAVRLALETEIVAVDEDGGFDTEQVVTAIEEVSGNTAESTAESTAVIEALRVLEGETLSVTIGPDGQPGPIELADDASPEVREMVEQFGSSFGAPPLSFPDEPIAVGDEWTDDLTVTNGGLEAVFDYTYRLTALDDETYTVEFVSEAEFDQAGATGETTITGSVTGVRGNPLLFDSSAESITEVSGSGLTSVQRMAIEVDAEPRS